MRGQFSEGSLGLPPGVTCWHVALLFRLPISSQERLTLLIIYKQMFKHSKMKVLAYPVLLACLSHISCEMPCVVLFCWVFFSPLSCDFDYYVFLIHQGGPVLLWEARRSVVNRPAFPAAGLATSLHVDDSFHFKGGKRKCWFYLRKK